MQEKEEEIWIRVTGQQDGDWNAQLPLGYIGKVHRKNITFMVAYIKDDIENWINNEDCVVLSELEAYAYQLKDKKYDGRPVR